MPGAHYRQVVEPVDADGKTRNFGFTTELHTKFKYQGGEVFSFEGDDDLWVFINHHLAVDLGGLHTAQSFAVDLDSIAGKVGIVAGGMFPLDLFYANREPPGAVLMISIPQADLWACH